MVRSAKDWAWSSYRATTGQVIAPGWLQAEWLLAVLGKRKVKANEAYKRFIKEGGGQPSPWASLKNQVYLGDELFVEKMQHLIDSDKELSEIPSSQRRVIPETLAYYESEGAGGDDAIAKAYASGGYSMKEIGDYFGLHYSRVSRILGGAKSKT